MLFIPTASSDSKDYSALVRTYFGTRLGCTVDVLNLISEKLTKKEISSKILGTDIIYVGGGNTFKMLRLWGKFGVDLLLKQAHKKGIVLSGLSAGSMCWFNYGNSDSRRFNNPRADLIKVTGLGLIPALHCPHYNSETDRKVDLKKMMKKTSGVAIAIDNCCALEVVDDVYKVISSKKSANAYKVYWSKGIFFEEKIIKRKSYYSLNELLKK